MYDSIFRTEEFHKIGKIYSDFVQVVCFYIILVRQTEMIWKISSPTSNPSNSLLANTARTVKYRDKVKKWKSPGARRMSKVLDFLKEVVPVLRGSQRKSQVNTHRGGDSRSLAQGEVSSKEVWNSVGIVSRKYMRTENPGM